MEENITFIVGAGALVDWNFKTGEQLKNEIIKFYKEKLILDNENNLSHYFNNLEFPDNLDITPVKVQEFINDLYNTPIDSTIDEFLNTHSSHKNKKYYKIIGLVGIYKILRNQEISHSERLNDFDIKYKNKNNWLEYLFQYYYKKYKFEFCKKVKIVTFNYTRVEEDSLYRCIKSITNNDEQAKNIFNEIEIIHVYGDFFDYKKNYSLKKSKEQNYNKPSSMKELVNDILNYREFDNSDLLERIKTIYSDREDDEVIKKIKKLLQKSQAIYFLGFGYNETNLKNIMPKTLDNLNFIGGTAYGLTTNEKEDKIELIQKLCPSILKLEIDIKFGDSNDTCLKFLEDNL